jgi:hypothetical protein
VIYVSGWGLIGAGGPDIDWDVAALAGYDFNERLSAVAGYRALGVDYSISCSTSSSKARSSAWSQL